MSSRPQSGGQSASGWLGTQGALIQGPSLPLGAPRLAMFGSMQVAFEESSVFTASIDLQAKTSLDGFPVAIAALATVEWAVEGVQLRRKFDVVGGASISGVAQGIMIKVEDRSPPGTPPGIPYVVSALVAPGPRPGGSVPPTYTPSPPIAVAPGGSASVLVPQAIGVRSVQVNAASLVAGVPVQALVRAQYIPYVGSVPSPVASDLGIWPLSGTSPFLALPPGAQAIVIQNLDATQPITASVTFGIDG